jgi:hypothetical protein
MGFRRSPNYRRVQKVFYFSLWTTYPNLQLIPLLDDHLCGQIRELGKKLLKFKNKIKILTMINLE